MKTRKHKRGRRKATPKQLAALARGRAAQKAKRAASPSRKRKKARRSRRGSLLSLPGRHRPVVTVAKGRLHRPKRSSIPSRATFANPFLGELAMIGNPKRRKKSSKKSSRKSSRRRSHGMFANPGGRALSAVIAGPREMASVDFIKDAGAVAAGFLLPNMIVAKLPDNLHDSRPKVYACKVAATAALSAAASLVSKRASKMILLGGGVSILLDAWVDFVSPMIGGAGIAPARTSGVDTYYGDNGVGVYYGDGVGSVAESFS